MDGFGIGVAGGVLIELAKAIIQVAQDFKANKHSARELSQRCEDSRVFLESVIADINSNGLRHDQIKDQIDKYVVHYGTLLRDIKDRMMEWKDKGPARQLLHKSQMAEDIKNGNTEVINSWRNFQTQLTGQVLAIGGLNNSLLESLTTSLRELTDKEIRWQFELAKAQQQDQMEIRDSLETIREDNWKYYRGIKDDLEIVKSKLKHGDAIVTVQYDKLLEALQGIDRGQELGQLQEELAELHRLLLRLAPSNSNNGGPATEEDPEVVKARKRIIDALRRYKALKPSYNIDSSELEIPGSEPVHRGNRSDIWRGKLVDEVVAIKKYKPNHEDIPVVLMRIQRQSKIWSSLTSDYVVPFFGCCGPKDEVPYVVTKWMGNGDLKSFLKDNPNKLNRLQVCDEILRGLEYLHSQKEPVYHGLLKPSNILVDDNLHARISDFALAFTETPTGTRADIERTTAPEIFDGEVPGPPADVYSFGCTAYEILTDIVPMGEEKNLWKFRKRVCTGEIRPTFPGNSETAARWGLARANAPLWQLLQDCWNLDPEQRPTAAEARSRWVNIMTEFPT